MNGPIMHDETPHTPNETPGAPEPVAPPPQDPPGGLSRRTKAWLGMGAVLAALVLLTLASDQSSYDPNAPPPAADLGPDGEPISDGSLAVGDLAPLSYTLKDMNGIDVNLASFKGKVILINFWATWCGPCRVEIPYLIELQEEYADDLVVLGVSVDDTPEKLKPYAAEMKINYPLLIGNGRQDFQDAYGPFWGIPVTVFVDRDGRIHRKHSGIASKEQFEQEIVAAL
jgi:cytochrome c biogenesis protein CcmG/thiol:disulfide interchange protein DsbE